MASGRAQDTAGMMDACVNAKEHVSQSSYTERPENPSTGIMRE